MPSRVSLSAALGLFGPAEAWSVPARFSPAERGLLEPAARLVLALFSPQGAQQPATLAVGALATLAAGTPDAKMWNDRLDELVRWSEEAGESNPAATFTRVPGAIRILRSGLPRWPAP